MTIEFDIIEDPPVESSLWKTWKYLVDSEGWTSDDNSVTALTPSLASTRSVFAVSKNDNNFIGTVIWNEYDNICFLGFFILAPEFRGKGCGMKIWKKALDRMPKGSILGLRGVPEMVEKYKSMSTPVVSTTLTNYKLSTRRYEKEFKSHCPGQNYSYKMVSDLGDTEWKQLMEFDKEVNERDRQQFLELYYKKLQFTLGMVLFDDKNNIIAHISAVPTSHPEDNIFKIAPLYAKSDQIAFSALKKFSEIMLSKYPTADVLFHILDTEKGNILHSFFHQLNIEPYVSGVTLYSSECPSFGDLTKVYIPHNNSCYYDY